ncbi:Phenylacetic acid catabolic protein [Calidifontibacillus oryziterrae]|uniref:Phenylacetic acid catabolic protein n=1 Tax=Calidifontibacillus oryziterrae TaxID=1191699 RepID=UPI0002E74291|nr:Phenylacetic acid catabolic protein [Calidifontibacillus oryziterrae]
MPNNENLLAIIPVVHTIADNKFVLGDRLVEIGIGGPDIEATLSAIAMAQAELGHARLMYNWTFDLEGLIKKPEIQAQTGRAFQNVVAIHNWITLIAASYVVNLAVDLVIKEIIKSSTRQVGSHFEKYLVEQKDHIIYSEGWAMQLLNDEGAIPRKFKEALSEVQNEVVQWLTSIETNKSLLEEQLISQNASLVKRLNERIGQITKNSGVTADVR